MDGIARMDRLEAKDYDREIGRRLRVAREAARMSQVMAASAVGIAATTLVTIEQGDREVRTVDLLALAKLYGHSGHAILRREAVHVDMVLLLREAGAVANGHGETAARLLSDLASAEVELENSLGLNRTIDYPPECPLLPGSPRQQAEDNAEALRGWLGLAPGPVVDIMALLEEELGLRVYSRPIHRSILGIFVWHEALGACMLSNSRHPPKRCKFAAAQALGHFMSMRGAPLVLVAEQQLNTQLERYVTSFASAFLMPREAVQQRFVDVASGKRHFTLRHVIALADMFDVSREAMVRRFEELEIARVGTWEGFNRDSEFIDQQTQSVRGEITSSPPAPRDRCTLPARLTRLAHEAWELDLYSEGQLSRLLRIHRRELRVALYEVYDAANLIR